MVDYEKRLAELKAQKALQHYCAKCGYVDDVYHKPVQETITVQGEKIEIDGTAIFCAKCNAQINDTKLDDERLKKAYAEYRKKHKLLFPDEIKQIREMYGLSAKNFARLLNIGEHTIYNFEAGGLQSHVHDSLIKGVDTYEKMLEYLSRTENRLSAKEIDKVKQKCYVNAIQKFCNTPFTLKITGFNKYSTMMG